MLDKVLAAEQPDEALVAFDAGKTTFRTEKYEGYKSGRSKTPSELSEQMPFIRELVEDRGIKTYELANYEADDIIGTLAREAEEAGDYEITVITGDRDLTQLTSELTTVQVSKKGVTELETYTPSYVLEKLGVRPDQIVEIKGLKGDTSDNYPGVTKVGDKTAQKLIQQFGSIAGIYDHFDDVSGNKLRENLLADRSKAELARELATINRQAPLTISLVDCKYTGPNIPKLIDFYERMDFKSFLAAMDPAANAQDSYSKIEYQELTADKLAELANWDSEMELQVELDDENYHTAKVVGFALGNAEHWFVTNNVELLNDEVLVKLLENNDVKKNVFDAKKTYVALNNLGIKLAGVNFDLLLASYLLNPANNSNDVAVVAREHEYQNVKTDEEVYGKGAKRNIPVDQPEFLAHLVHKVAAIGSLKDDLFTDLDKHNQTDLYWKMELPMALVLARMEIAGITVEANRLEEMGSKLKERMAELEVEIYRQAGEEFNIGSPKQLGHILFDKLKLPVIKKTKTGYSTAVDVLEKLAPDAPIVQSVLDYRQVSKLLSTYITGLLKVINPDDGKIHTRYLQTLTATGRLSSVDPNLQNIPIRSEEGKQIRSAFVPSHSEEVIFSSDYSQIELRVLASISGDKNMQEAFREGEDIHAATARRIFGLDSNEQVTPELRRQAKAVNFGIVYGISDYGLAQNTGITRKQAKQFIDRYFEEYPGVKQYVSEIVDFAKEHGYVETLEKRRRYLPDINSSNFNRRSFAERTAMNTPIQGSAADIIKKAMISMDKALEGYQTKMLLQVHDELIFEVPLSELDEIKKIVPQIMDSAVKLAIPLKVESHYGKTWYDAK
ncbi:DNA-directed DNA polymerase [Lentilactobacillus senioris DSM 24302 = JCM 17472]|uniref:DNA polymerase I n=2 Tax=Lentilactobacillus senioris TaxID=931534 RepID=A0A0R2CSI5_9LACO|nr:DNA-directed DNA polymerase [Lentilactobacillus senioris DSM 24302 = JCM 17472]